MNRPGSGGQAARQGESQRLLGEAVSLKRLGRTAEALAALDRVLQISPADAAAYNFRGNLLLELGRGEEAIAAYDRALALRPDYPEPRNNRGIALIACRRFTDAEADFQHLVALKPGDPGALYGLGIALAGQGKHAQAVACFDRVIASGAADPAQFKSRAQSLQQLNRIDAALSDYGSALAFGDDAECLVQRGMLLLSCQRDAEAAQDFSRALARTPADPHAWLGQGIALLRLNRLEDAVAAFDESLRLRPDNADALYNRGAALARLKRHDAAIRDAEALLRIAPDYRHGLGLLLHSRLYACDWRDFAGLRSSAQAAVDAGKPAVQPFLYLAISDSPAGNLQAARIFAQSYDGMHPPLWRGERYHHDRIRIAYLSADFYRHATAFLMADVFQHHDRQKFQTVAVSYGPDDASDIRHRLKRSFDTFLDVRGASDASVAERLRAFEIDIAVDLKGYTGEARPGILARRPAPVQAHYLGYPGSLGTSHIDYLLADEIIVPPQLRDAYAERIVRLPGCYQCNAPIAVESQRPTSRAEAGLPEQAFVFCSFNSSFKITPEMFEIWMRLLDQTPGSVLWLLESTALASANLRSQALSRGIAAERLVFAPLIGRDEHLARLPLADLALDTFPYGAHTTASDAVRAGLPLLTLMGESFAARVGASILTAAGMAEMIATTPAEYESRAATLAHDRQALATIRARLRNGLRESPLFDGARFTRHLESAFLTMHQRQCGGLPPADFAVPATRS